MRKSRFTDEKMVSILRETDRDCDHRRMFSRSRNFWTVKSRPIVTPPVKRSNALLSLQNS